LKKPYLIRSNNELHSSVIKERELERDIFNCGGESPTLRTWQH